MTLASVKNRLTRTGAIAAAVLTLGAGLLVATDEAQARPRWGVGLGVGLAAGALIGAAAASSAYAGPGYYYAPEYRRCRRVARYDYYGRYVGSRRVCEIY